MSRFFDFEWEGLCVRVRPDGWRKRRIASWLPYRTGDRLRLTVRLSGTSRVGAEVLTVSTSPEAFDSDPDQGFSFPWRPLGATTEQTLEFTTPRFGWSGEHLFLIAFAREELARGIVPCYSTEAASVQVISDYKPLAYALTTFFGVVLGIVGTLIAQVITR